MKRCFYCGNRLKISEKPTRDETCPFCDTDLKTCMNCEFYDPSRNNQCSEPMAEPVREKDRANFCEYFVFRESTAPRGQKHEDDRLQDLKRLFTDLP